MAGWFRPRSELSLSLLKTKGFNSSLYFLKDYILLIGLYNVSRVVENQIDLVSHYHKEGVYEDECQGVAMVGVLHNLDSNGEDGLLVEGNEVGIHYSQVFDLERHRHQVSPGHTGRGGSNRSPSQHIGCGISLLAQVTQTRNSSSVSFLAQVTQSRNRSSVSFLAQVTQSRNRSSVSFLATRDT